MPKLRLDDYGASRPKLTPEDLDESPCLLTIAVAEEVEVPDAATPSGVRKALTLTFTEFQDKVMWLNRTQIETLIRQLGDDTDAWEGATVPVEVHVAEYRGQRFPKVRVVPDEGWETLVSSKSAHRARPARPVKASGGRR